MRRTSQRKTKSILPAVSKVVSRPKELRNIRRAFRRFNTEQAWTFVVRFNGKRRFCRVHRHQNARYQAERNRDILDLFNMLYPNNSISPVGVMNVPARAVLTYYKEEFERATGPDSGLNELLNKGLERRLRAVQKFPLWGVITEIKHGQSIEFKRYQQQVRGHVSRFSPTANRHIRFMDEVGYPTARKIFKESGINVSYPGNISNVNGSPIYFEPKITSPRRLIAFIQTKPLAQRRKLMVIVTRLGLV
jgi:hypothetical protein